MMALLFFFYLLICLLFPRWQLDALAGYATGKFVRYTYASGTVYLFWIYAHSEPGLGTNLQTVTLIAVLAGRYYAYLFTTAWMAYELYSERYLLAPLRRQTRLRSQGRR